MRNISMPLMLIVSLFPISDMFGGAVSSRPVLSRGQQDLVKKLKEFGLLPNVLNPIIAQYAVTRPSQTVPYICISGDYQRIPGRVKFSAEYVGRGEKNENLPLALSFFPGENIQCPTGWYPDQLADDVSKLFVSGDIAKVNDFSEKADKTRKADCKLFPGISYATRKLFYALSRSRVEKLSATAAAVQMAKDVSAIHLAPELSLRDLAQLWKNLAGAIGSERNSVRWKKLEETHYDDESFADEFREVHDIYDNYLKMQQALDDIIADENESEVPIFYSGGSWWKCLSYAAEYSTQLKTELCDQATS